MTESLAGGAVAVPVSMRAAANITSAVVRAARQLLTDLERDRRIDVGVLRSAMKAALGASDADGAWNWKTAYDTCEAATVLFVRKFGPVMRSKPGSTVAMLPLLARIANYLQIHTRRSEDCQALQLFSTPIPLGLAACTAAGITPADRILKPSAPTGLLATFAEKLQSIRIPGSCAHLIKLVQSAAVASAASPKPNDRPHRPSSLMADGVLSDARLGAGKGPQVAGILLDNWLKGRRRAVWISKPAELIEDAQRDWSAPGMAWLLVRPLSRFRQDTPIRLSEGVRFTTYATLPTDERDEMLSRVTQIVEWLGSDFDRMIVFEESYAKTVFELAEDLQLRRVRVMGVNRTEVSGFNGTMGDHPKSYGRFREIISWKLRRFVPADAIRPGIRAQMRERNPLGRVAEREAA